MKDVIQISLDLDLNTLRECRSGSRLGLDLLDSRSSIRSAQLTKVVSVNIPTWPRL